MRFIHFLYLFVTAIAFFGCETLSFIGFGDPGIPPLLEGDTGDKEPSVQKIIDDPDGDERQPTVVGENKIAYSSNVTGDFDLYLFDVTKGTETGALQITNSKDSDTSPSFRNASSEGEFYYVSDDFGDVPKIFGTSLARPVGTATLISRNHAVDQCPSISPSGRVLVYSSRPEDEDDYYLWTLNLETGQNQRWDPGFRGRWSPEGDRIVYAKYEADRWNVWLLDLTTGHTQRLTSGEFAEFDPEFSPDGNFIAFTSNQGGDSNIWIMGYDGANPTPITTHPAIDCEPTWSPDGQWIYFASNRNQSFGIYRIDVSYIVGTSSRTQESDED